MLVILKDYGTERKNPEGKVTEILGHVSDPGTDVLSMIKDMICLWNFREKVMNQAEAHSRQCPEGDPEWAYGSQRLCRW